MKEPGIRLVPYVVSTLQLEQMAGETEDSAAEVNRQVREGTMLHNLISSSTKLSEEQQTLDSEVRPSPFQRPRVA